MILTVRELIYDFLIQGPLLRSWSAYWNSRLYWEGFITSPSFLCSPRWLPFWSFIINAVFIMESLSLFSSIHFHGLINDNCKFWICKKSMNIFLSSDLTVEHAQLLLFLFHGLPLMLKKTLLLKIGQCILEVNETLKTK